VARSDSGIQKHHANDPKQQNNPEKFANCLRLYRYVPDDEFEKPAVQGIFTRVEWNRCPAGQGKSPFLWRLEDNQENAVKSCIFNL
jgi:hypothetical protein